MQPFKRLTRLRKQMEREKSDQSKNSENDIENEEEGSLILNKDIESSEEIYYIRKRNRTEQVNENKKQNINENDLLDYNSDESKSEYKQSNDDMLKNQESQEIQQNQEQSNTYQKNILFLLF